MLDFGPSLPPHDLLYDMYQMPDTAIEAILREWDLQEHDPPNSDIREWIRTIEQLCDTYGIPGTQRPQCATRFVKGGLRARLESVLKDARTQVGPILWAQFANFMVALDRRLDSIVIELLLIELLQRNFKHGKVSAPSFPFFGLHSRTYPNRTPTL